MYLAHFGLSEPPFGITPDTRFAFASRAQRDAIETLLVSLRLGEGFVKVTGEVGTGKTLACRRVLQALQSDAEVRVVYLPNPAMSARGLLAGLCRDLGLATPADADRDALDTMLAQALLEHAQRGVHVVALLDEAQAMPVEALEALRLLSNLETERTKLLRVVLFGQPELDALLARRDLRQLAQRIAFQHALAPMSADETAAYLDHRMRVAGHRGTNAFPWLPARAIHRAARGTPRLVNVLAHKCLLLACGQGASEVSLRHAEAAVRDTPVCRRLDLGGRFALRLGALAGVRA